MAIGRRNGIMVMLAAATLAGCTVGQGGESDTTVVAQQAPVAAAPVDTAPAAPQPTREMQIEVDLAARKLYVMRDEQRLAEYGVAVGSEKWPTQTGAWNITQVVWNPEWIPPRDESWTEDKEGKQPGEPDNPLGRVQLIYDPPRTIHGTNEPASIGKAVSHGSIRMTNATAIELAKRVMEVAGAGKDDAWYDRVQGNRTEKVIVDLPSPVPIRVR